MEHYQELQMAANEAKDNYYRFWFSQFLAKGAIVEDARAKAITFTEADLKLVPGSFTPISHLAETELF